MFLIFKKRAILSAIIIALLFVMCFVGLGQTCAAEVYFGSTLRKIPVYGVDTEEKVVAISFDAAWGADKTRGIIDIINKYEIKATFFLVGFWINKYQEEVKLISENGIEIGNHSDNHLKMSTLSEDEIRKEIVTVNESLKKITGKDVKFFRPPFGDYNDKLINVLESLNMTTIQWSVDSLDWKGISGDEITQRVVSRVKNGSIILCHNNSDHILDALPAIILNLKNKGFKFVTMSELVYEKDFYIDNNGIQHKI